MLILLDFNFSDNAERYWFYGQLFLFFFLVVYFILMLRSKHKTELQTQKDMYHGFGWFVFSTVLAQGIYVVKLIWDFTDQGEFIPRKIRIGGTGYEYVMFMCFSLGFIFLMKPIEQHILHKENLWITKLNKITLIFMVIPYIGSWLYYQPPWNDYWTYAAYPGLVLVILSALFSMFGSFFFYIRLGIVSSGLIRRKGFLIGIGIILMYIGLIAGSEIKSSIGGWAGAILGPGVMLVGAIMVIIGHRIQI
ncbi:MAG: hypothetical protein GF364_07305 [Candidatus Lokiarchaeota archaeon]|nr:hypothetical protein [Candidatus Lokiarchaeota archaeon]